MTKRIKVSNEKENDLVKITPGKRKFKEEVKNIKTAKKSKFGKADYT